MRIPYVIDNQTHLLANVLNTLLAEHKERSLDLATAYFTVGGFGPLHEGLLNLGNPQDCLYEVLSPRSVWFLGLL